MKEHMTAEEELEGPILFWGYKEQESNLILPEYDDDDDDEKHFKSVLVRLPLLLTSPLK
jgi:hypothetical protein